MSYQLIQVDGAVSLSWTLPYDGGTIIADINDLVVSDPVLFSTAGLSLPQANQAALGSSAVFNNVGLFPCWLLTYGGGNPTGGLGDYYIQPGEVVSVYLISNDDANGTWRIVPFGGGSAGIVSMTTKNTTDNSIVVSNSDGVLNPTSTAPGGTVSFATNKSLSNILALVGKSSAGLLTVNQVNGILTYGTASIAQGTNITVSNPNGIAASPTIGLATDLTKLTSVAVGDLKIQSGVINTTVNHLALNKVTIDQLGNVKIPGTLTVDTNNSSLVVGQAQAFVSFSDTGSGCASSIAIGDSLNIKTITGSKGQYTITFTKPFKAATYAAIISLTIQYGGGFVSPYLAYITTKSPGSVNILCMDIQGNLSAPTSGVSIAIFSQQG